MAKISRLTNLTRSKIRAPFLYAPVGPVVLASLFPVIQRPTAKPAQKRQTNLKSNGEKTRETNSNSGSHKVTQKMPYTQNRSGNAPQPSGPNAARKPSFPERAAQAPTTPSQQPGSPSGNNKPTTRAPGLFLPNTRVERTDAETDDTRKADSDRINPPTRPIQPARIESASGKNSGSRQEGPARNGFSHHSNGFSRPVAPQTTPPRPVPAQARQEPATQIPLEEPLSKPAVTPSPPANAEKKPSIQQRLHEQVVQGVKSLLDQQPDLPVQASLLGVCDDGFPVLLDLYDPKPGALIVIGDEREEQLNVLRSAIASLAMRNTPRSVQLLIISCEPESWRSWIEMQGYHRHCIGIEGVEDLDTLSEWIIRLGDWIEQRRLGDRSGPPVLVVFDTLSFMPRLAYDIRLNFEWMAKEGPPAQIWPMATISTDLADLLNNRRMLRAFRTRVLGFTEKDSFYAQIASLDNEAAATFGEPGVFAVQVGESWLRFRLPLGKHK